MPAPLIAIGGYAAFESLLAWLGIGTVAVGTAVVIVENMNEANKAAGSSQSGTTSYADACSSCMPPDDEGEEEKKKEEQEKRLKELEEESTLTDDRDNLKNFEKKGTMDDANADFDSLNIPPEKQGNFKTKWGDGRSGKLENGGTIGVRPGSSSTNEPTLQYDPPVGPTIKWRYK